MLSVAEADALIRARITTLDTRTVPIIAASGGILRQHVYAERDQPPFDRVTMDGIAIAHGAWVSGRREFQVQATQAAGAPAGQLRDDSCCIEVMTGTSLPAGCDCVIPVERTARHGEQIVVEEAAAPQGGQFIHRQGSDYPREATLLAPGTVLRAPEMAVLASSGLADVRIARQPRIAILPSGDELVAPGAPIQPYQIRRSNDHAVAGALATRGFTDVTVEHLRDEPAQLTERIRHHRDHADVLLLSGGVSMGKYDYIPGVLKALDIELVLHKVAQRPGKPMWVGMHASGTAVFALPGNPVSSLVCLYRYALPAIYQAMGANPTTPRWVPLARAISFRPALTWFLPVTVDDEGRAEPRSTNTSGDFAALAGTTGFIELGAGQNDFEAGHRALLTPW